MKVLRSLAYIITGLMFAWFVASYIEVVRQNCYFNPEYNPLNLFVLIGEWIR